MLSETWYSCDFDFFVVPGYEHFAPTRTGKRGGGVSIHVRFHLKVYVLDEFTTIKGEYVVIALKNESNIFCVSYRPPKRSPCAIFYFP